MTAQSNAWLAGFIGPGQMATALARGFVKSGFLPAERIVASDPVAEIRTRFIKETGGRCVASNADVAREADVLFLAVKPQQMPAVLEELSGVVTARHLVVSIAAGVPLKAMTRLGASARLVRVMPNTPCLLGEGASAFALGGGANDDDGRLVEQMLSTVGLAARVSEKLLDAVTGLSGSGPAYAYLMIEAMSDGGVRMGLPRDVATRLAAQTLLGAARMVLETGKHPGALKDAVTSPGGTTIAGLHELERGGLRGCLMNAVEAATLRATELAGPA